MAKFCIRDLSNNLAANNYLYRSGTPPKIQNGRMIVNITPQSRPPYRSEYSLVKPGLPPILRSLKLGTRYRIFIDVGIQRLTHERRKDPLRGNAFIITQVHGNPDLHLGEPYRNPCLNVTVESFGDDNHFRVRIGAKQDADKVTPRGQYDRASNLIFPGPYKVGSRMQIVVEFDYVTSGGTLVATVNGKTKRLDHGIGYNDQKGAYVKVGAYVPNWKSGKRGYFSATFDAWCFENVNRGSDAGVPDEQKPSVPKPPRIPPGRGSDKTEKLRREKMEQASNTNPIESLLMQIIDAIKAILDALRRQT